jgi:ribosomal protein S18 acetylase RimI-like enzyme
MLTPLPDSPVPSAAFVRRCCEQLAARGFRRVVTGALAPAEQAGFRAAGFEVVEELRLLAHDLSHLPPDHPTPARLRRAAADDRPLVLDVDGDSFDPFWQLGTAGLDDALTATPRVRFRVAELADGTLAGYAVTGRAGRRGFLQRLAVRPDLRRLGIGQHLVLDGLRWLRRWRVERALVNTQAGNTAALALYLRLGFSPEPGGLSVLACGLRQ